MNHHDAIAIRYAELVAEAGDEGMQRREAAKLIAEDMRALEVAGELEVPTDWDELVLAELRTIDDHDRGHQEDRLRIARDALNDETIKGTTDDVLDAVCVVGQGKRKTYRNLTVDDLLDIVMRKSAAARRTAEAAERSTEFVRDLTRAMRVKGVDTLGELYG